MGSGLTLEISLFLFLTEYFVRGCHDVVKVCNQNFLGDMLVGVAGILLEGGDELVAWLQSDRGDLLCQLRIDLRFDNRDVRG